MLSDRDPDPHVCIEQSDRPVFKHVMGAWLQFVYFSKKAFSSNVLLLEFSFPLPEFFVLHSTSREADDEQMEPKGS